MLHYRETHPFLCNTPIPPFSMPFQCSVHTTFPSGQIAQTEQQLLRVVYTCTEQEVGDAMTTEMLGRGWSKFEASGRPWGQMIPPDGRRRGFAWALLESARLDQRDGKRWGEAGWPPMDWGEFKRAEQTMALSTAHFPAPPAQLESWLFSYRVVPCAPRLGGMHVCIGDTRWLLVPA